MTDFIFSKEVRLGTYAADSKGHRNDIFHDSGSEQSDADVADSGLPPSAVVAKSKIRMDPMATPQYAERVPYIVIYNEKGRLIDWVVNPERLLSEPHQIHAVYYITKQIIPATSRVLNLIGIDVNRWYQDLPKPARRIFLADPRRTLDRFMVKSSCISCGASNCPHDRLCTECHSRPVETLWNLVNRVKDIEKDILNFMEASRHSCSVKCDPRQPLDNQEVCWSIHCPLFWRHVVLRHRDVPYLAELLQTIEKFSL